MTATTSRLYENYADAQRAITSLEAAGVPHSDLSIIANNSDNWYGAEKKVDRTEEGAATGAEIGAGLGGAAGLLAGLGVLAIPGLGPVVAAGWLASTTLGVMAGAATGTIVGALTVAGVSEEEAPLYAEGVRRGGTLVSARVPEAERARFESILDQSAVNIRERSAAWQRSGWETFDASAQPYTADDVRKERELP